MQYSHFYAYNFLIKFIVIHISCFQRGCLVSKDCMFIELNSQNKYMVDFVVLLILLGDVDGGAQLASEVEWFSFQGFWNQIDMNYSKNDDK